MKRYCLEIYSSGSAEDEVAVIESDTPFGSIAKGDLINPLGTAVEAGQEVLRVVGVEHIIWDAKAEGIKHKICIFTSAEKNNASTRLS